MAEDCGVEGLNFGYTESGLDRQGCDGGGAEDSVGGEDLEVGGDAGAVGGVEASDGEGYRGFCGAFHGLCSRKTRVRRIRRHTPGAKARISRGYEMPRLKPWLT